MIRLGDYFSIVRGNAKNLTDKQAATDNAAVRLLSATADNNGGSKFVVPLENETVYSNVITINNNGSVGYVFYHPYSVIASSDVTIIMPKDNHRLTEKSALYLKTVIEKQKDRFAYGYKISNTRLKNLNIHIPLDEHSKIDWLFMEKTVTETYKELPNLPETRNCLKNSLDLRSKDWKQFVLGDTSLFSIKSGKDLPQYQRIHGNIPFVGASSKNNGITDWIDTSANSNKYAENVVGVNRNGSVGETFYHPYKAYFSGDTRFIKTTKFDLTTAIGLFLSVVIKQQKEQFSYGYKLGSDRLKNLKINLPVDDNGDPDWKFMEDYIKSLPNGDLV